MGTTTEAWGISGNNVVGSYQLANTYQNIGFLYDGTNFTTISDPLGVEGTTALGIDGNNIVGNYVDASDVTHGFLYNGTTYTTIDDPLGTDGTILEGIQGNTIVGQYIVPNMYGTSTLGFVYDDTPSATPEPATIVLATLGFGGLVTFGRRRRSTG